MGLAAHQFEAKAMFRCSADDIVGAVPEAAALCETVQRADCDGIRIIVVGKGSEDKQSAAPEAASKLGEMQSGVTALLPAQANERLVYSCRPKAGG